MPDRNDAQAREARENRIKNVQKQIAELKSRWPAHSVPPAMIQQLDELEEELEQLRKR
jgi:hypothetical protein